MAAGYAGKDYENKNVIYNYGYDPLVTDLFHLHEKEYKRVCSVVLKEAAIPEVLDSITRKDIENLKQKLYNDFLTLDILLADVACIKTKLVEFSESKTVSERDGTSMTDKCPMLLGHLSTPTRETSSTLQHLLSPPRETSSSLHLAREAYIEIIRTKMSQDTKTLRRLIADVALIKNQINKILSI